MNLLGILVLNRNVLKEKERSRRKNEKLHRLKWGRGSPEGKIWKKPNLEEETPSWAWVYVRGIEKSKCVPTINVHDGYFCKFSASIERFYLGRIFTQFISIREQFGLTP